MDYDSSSKFISSLAKFLQSLCNGYVEFDSGVQVIGHLYLSVDTGKTIDYILNEKVCKTDENSVTFISNSFHAQPAEKPKPPGKRLVKDSDNYISAQGEPRSTNVGTLPPARNENLNSSLSQGAKRSYSPSHKPQSKTGRTSPRHKKSRTESLDLNTSQVSYPASENSISSVPSLAADCGPSNTISGAPLGSYLSESYQQSYFHPDEESSLADESEERDIKPSIDTDVTFIKEEYAPSSSCSQSGRQQSRDRTHGDESSAYPYQTNQVFPGSYPGQGGFGASQRANLNSSGSPHMFSPGQSPKIEETSGDPSVRQMVKLEEIKHPLDKQDDSLVSSLFAVDQKAMRGHSDLKKTPPKWTERPRKFTCHFCLKSFVVKRDWEGHINSIHLKAKPFLCYICSWSSSHRGELQKHVKKCTQKYGHLTELSAAEQGPGPST